MFDTNVWIDVSRGQINGQALRAKAGAGVVLSPFTIMELVRGTINGSEEQFARDQQMFKCMSYGSPEILESPQVFVKRILWNLDWGVGLNHPKHFQGLLQMLISSKSLADFARDAEGPGSTWKKLTELRSMHETYLDRQLNALVPLAKEASVKAASVSTSRMYACGGLIADPVVIEQRFSAAIEFLRSSILKVRRGAKPWRNDRGSFVDQQLFFIWQILGLSLSRRKTFPTT
jgi:hypothetical protein